jgi:hypothetical protein
MFNLIKFVSLSRALSQRRLRPVNAAPVASTCDARRDPDAEAMNERVGESRFIAGIKMQ